MPPKGLGRLEEVDLRTIWTSEAGDFTPWLAEEENLGLLGDTIGIELELEAQEKNVGPFRADILCKDTANGSWVLIENQLEKTDHAHLGQLLTYASGLKAVTIVWIAYRFTEEHRASLDWLNEITDDRFNFFGCKPNDWTKSVHPPAGDGELSETKLLQREYWAALGQHMKDQKSVVKPQKPLPQHWANFALGRSYFWILAAVNTQKKQIWVAVVCGGPDGKAHFHILKEDKQQIEKEVEFPLEWQELPGKKESRIEIRRKDIDPMNQSGWSQQHEWIAERLEALYRVFSPRVKKLDASEYEPEHESLNNQSAVQSMVTPT